MCKAYRDYLKSLSNCLVRAGVMLPVDFDGDYSSLFKSVYILEEYLYFNRVLSLVDSRFKIDTFYQNSQAFYNDLLMSEILSKYEGTMQNSIALLYAETGDLPNQIVEENSESLCIRNFNEFLDYKVSSSKGTTDQSSVVDGVETELVYSDSKSSEQVFASLCGSIKSALSSDSNSSDEYEEQGEGVSNEYDEYSEDGYSDEEEYSEEDDYSDEGDLDEDEYSEEDEYVGDDLVEVEDEYSDEGEDSSVEDEYDEYSDEEEEEYSEEEEDEYDEYEEDSDENEYEEDSEEVDEYEEDSDEYNEDEYSDEYEEDEVDEYEEDEVDEYEEDEVDEYEEEYSEDEVDEYEELDEYAEDDELGSEDENSEEEFDEYAEDEFEAYPEEDFEEEEFDEYAEDGFEEEVPIMSEANGLPSPSRNMHSDTQLKSTKKEMDVAVADALVKGVGRMSEKFSQFLKGSNER